jgi:adenine-specific DNA-methyltransferase
MTMKRLTADDPATRSPDLAVEHIERLKALFPELVTEGPSGASIKVDVLKALVGDKTVVDADEKYGLNWHGKRRAHQLALTPSTGTLRPCPEESVDWGTTQNLMIEGDNLEVLKLFQKSYAGKVKLIYIDPPYNTGKDFVYPDNFQDSIKNYLELTGQVEGGATISSNTEASGRFHTDWLNMMYPRLKLARLLLSDDGALLVSINDVEAPRLRMVLDEVFGEESFVCQFVWNNEGNIDQQSKIKGVHEYVLAYMRHSELLAAPTVIDPNIEEDSKLFNEQIENSITKNGPANPPSTVALPEGFPATFERGSLPPRDDAWPHILDEIVVADGRLGKPARVHSGWSSRNLLDLFIRNGCVPLEDSSGKKTWFALTPTGAIYGYKKRSELQGHVLSVIRNVGTTKQNSNVLKGWGIDFAYPKPLLLIQYLVQVFTRSDAQHIVCDLFAGSGTTGHAVLAQNGADGGDRRLLMVQLPESTGSAGRFVTIADITKERLRRAKAKIKEERPMFAGDLGFRVFKLSSSNIREWEPDRDDLDKTLLESVDHLKPGRTESDVLYELLLKLGLDLCVPTERRTSGGKDVHAVGGGVLMACLAERIERGDVEALAQEIVEWHKELAPGGSTTCVFRDSAFADDVAKTNMAAILEQHGIANVRSL